MKRLCGFFLTLALSCSLTAIPVFAKPDWPADTGVQSEAGIVMDMDSGAVLFAQNIHVQLPPASITKLLTALVVAEHASMDEQVTFSHDAVYNVESGSGNKLGLEEGDVLSVKDSLSVMLLQSSNQAANALAEHVAGSREAFADMMNEKAEALGCRESNFENPSGLNDEAQLTSAYDMAMIGAAAFSDPEILEICSAKKATLPPTKNNPEGRTYSLEHKLVVTEDGTSEYYYPEAVAGKTGYTSLAGQTLVTYAVKDDRRQVAVTLKSTQKTHYSDTKTILDFGFKRFKNVNVAENETHYITGEEPVEINGVSYLPSELYLDDTAVITLPNDAEFGDADQYLQTEIPENHPEGAVGRIIYSYNDRQIGVAWLYTTKALSSAAEPSQEAPEQTDPSSSKEPSEKKGISLPGGLIAGAGAAVLLLIAVCGIYAAVQQRKEKERLARMKERRRKRLEEMGCSQDEFERLLNDRKAALGKRTANDEPEDLL
ncbi:MAG: D-alanyl-D-alanine carboxypeptidase [Clostridium sp.]|nr:D-alanyl-D-alanine carboxypeptidase [Clostridium sp.]